MSQDCSSENETWFIYLFTSGQKGCHVTRSFVAFIIITTTILLLLFLITHLFWHVTLFINVIRL